MLPTSLVFLFVVLPYGAVMAFVAAYGLEQDVSQIGLYFTVFAVALFVVRLGVGRVSDRYGVTVAIVPGLVSMFAGLVILWWADSLVIFLISAVLFGLGFGVVLPLLQATAYSFAPIERRGAASATLFATADIGYGLRRDPPRSGDRLVRSPGRVRRARRLHRDRTDPVSWSYSDHASPRPGALLTQVLRHQDRRSQNCASASHPREFRPSSSVSGSFVTGAPGAGYSEVGRRSSISAMSASARVTSTTSRFSVTRSSRRLPGIGTTVADLPAARRARPRPGVTYCRSAISLTRSTIGWFASNASGVKRGNRLRMSFAANDSPRPTVPVRKP